MKEFFPKTIKFKITIVIIMSIIITTIIISYFCFSTFQKLRKKSLIESTGTDIQLVMKNIEKSMEYAQSIAVWCTDNYAISSYVASAPDKMSDGQKLKSYNRLKEELLDSRSSKYVRTLLVSNYKNALIQCIDNSYEGRLSDGITSRELPYFNELIQADGFKWIGLQKDPYNKKSDEFILPIIRPIYGSDLENNGWVYLALKPTIITDYLQSYKIKDDSKLYMVIDGTIYEYDGSKLNEVSSDFKVISKSTAEYNSDISYYLIKDDEGNYKTVVTYVSDIMKGWCLAESIPNEEFGIQKSVYFKIIMMISALLFVLGIVLTVIFNRMFNRPISRINKKMHEISGGDFSNDISIEGSDEIGSIGKGINELAQNVANLLNSRIEDEKQKKELEFKMLQSQINPHFLYNTLNSIKWMAMIQKASGIPEMTTSLARLLKNISKGTNELITIREEINLLKDYIIIQQYKYGGNITVKYDIDDEELKECEIIKFTLQPVVENAIFHGIEPKGSSGIIDIKIRRFDKGSIVIHIIDDGIGMSEGKINELISGKETKSKDNFNKIGVSNVNERIKLAFGNGYGLKIKSKVGEYTDAIITIPYKHGK